MITNYPSPDNFERQAIQYMYQSLDLIWRAESQFENEDTEVDPEEYWKYHQGVLNNSLLLMFIAIENFLKMEICKISSLLLLDGEPKKWACLESDRPFNDFYIRQFDDLIVLYIETKASIINTSTINKLKEIKSKRNLIVHGLFDEALSPTDICEMFYVFVVHFWGPNIWWRKMKNYLFNSPTFGYYDSDFEQCQLIKMVDMFVNHLKIKRTGELFGVDLKGRRYYCPYCHSSLNHDFDFDEEKYAVLQPNAPDSKNLFCLVCEKSHIVERRGCTSRSCKGNVISADDNQCLTCMNDQER